MPRLNPITFKLEPTDEEIRKMNNMSILLDQAPANETNGLGEANPVPTEEGRSNRPQEVMKYFTNKENIQDNANKRIDEELKAANEMPIMEQPQTDQVIEPEQIVETKEVSPLEKTQSILDQYKKLTENRRDSNTNLDLLSATNKIAQGIALGSGAKIDDGSDIIAQLKKSQELPVQDLLGQSRALELQKESEMNDPNSSISKFAREKAVSMAKQLNMDKNAVAALNDMTAKQLEDLGFKSMMINPYQQQMLELSRERLNKDLARLDLNKDQFTNKKSEHMGKLAVDFNKALDSFKLTKNSEAGRAAYSLGAARQLQLVVNSRPPEQMGRIEVEEIANMANRMLTSGSTSARSAVEQLVPKTLVGDLAKMTEYITNQVQSKNAKDFINMFKKLADREASYSTNIINKYMKSTAPAFKELAEKDPQTYNDILQSRFGFIQETGTLPKQSLEDLNQQTKSPVIPSAQNIINNDNEMVPIIGPNGKIGKILKKNYDKAIATGRYKPVEK